MRTNFDNILRTDALGLSSIAEAYGGRRIKPWLLTAAGIAGSLVSSLIGGKRSSNAVNEAKAEEARRHAGAMANWYRKENESILDTSTGQNAVRLANEFNDRNWKRAQGSAAVGGGTDASVAMQKESGNKMMSDTMANLAVQDTNRKDNANRARMQEEQNHSNAVQNMAMQKAQGVSQAASGASYSFLAGLNLIQKSTGKLP